MSTNIITIAMVAIKAALALLGLIIFASCFLSMRNQTRGKGALVILQNPKGRQEYPVLFWENSIGRSKSCDIFVDDSTVSRDHAVIFGEKRAGLFQTPTLSPAFFLMEKKSRARQK